jgi:hypothetical protein
MSAIYPLWASIVSDFEQTLISNAPVQLQVIASLNVIDIGYCPVTGIVGFTAWNTYFM